MSDLKHVAIYTDGACKGNPGPGGYGAVMIYGKHRKELSGGFRRTTNNRMELMACIVALKALKEPCEVTLCSDSRYAMDGLSKGWARRWRARGWLKQDKRPPENVDLWKALLDLVEVHHVTCQWVRGHRGHAENERCDLLASTAAQGADLPADPGFEG